MKRRDLIIKLQTIAKDRGLEYFEEEGGNHTKVYVGRAQTVVARHSEINEITARNIIKHVTREAQ